VGIPAPTSDEFHNKNQVFTELDPKLYLGVLIINGDCMCLFGSEGNFTFKVGLMKKRSCTITAPLKFFASFSIG